MAVFNDRRITKLIESVGADAEQGIQGLSGDVAALRTEVAEAVRQVQQHADSARQGLTRDLADRDRKHLAELLASLRRELAPLRPPPPSAGPTAAPPVTESSAPTEPEAGMDKLRPDARSDEAPEAETLQDLFDVLTRVALISTAEIQCHPHTWAFIVRHVAQQDLVHELLPETQDQEPHALIAVNVSGPVLMGILNALHQARERPKGQALTRADIQEKALAGALYTRLSRHLANPAGPGDGTRTRIVIDDRPTEDPPTTDDGAETTTTDGSPAAGATGETQRGETEDTAAAGTGRRSAAGPTT